jgi:Divergent InlB B-repeat domain
VRTPRVPVALAVLLLALAAAGPVSAATFDSGLVGIGTGESSSPTTGFGHLDTSQCVVGNIPVSQTETTYYRCSLEFDLDAMPDNAVVTAATLSVYTSPIDPCGSIACGMVLSGYVGNAATTLGDLTAGSPIGEESMGTGAYSHYDVKSLVKSVLAGPDFPAAGFNFAGDPQNPPGAWTVVGHPAGPNPPTLVITYSIPVSVTVAVAPAGTGTVAAEASSISCPGTCSGSFLPGAQVKLHANPANGFAFSKWTGSVCAGQGTVCSFTMPSTAVSVTATFASTAPPTATPNTSKAPVKTAAPAQSARPAATTLPSTPTETISVTGAPPSASDASQEPAALPSPVQSQPPLEPTADSSGPSLLVIGLIVVLAIGVGGGAYLLARRRQTG